MTLAKRQRLLAEYLTDETVRARVRANPETVANERSVDLAFARWLAALEPRRVKSFVRSAKVKDRCRGR